MTTTKLQRRIYKVNGHRYHFYIELTGGQVTNVSHRGQWALGKSERDFLAWMEKKEYSFTRLKRVVNPDDYPLLETCSKRFLDACFWLNTNQIDGFFCPPNYGGMPKSYWMSMTVDELRWLQEVI